MDLTIITRVIHVAIAMYDQVFRRTSPSALWPDPVVKGLVIRPCRHNAGVNVATRAGITQLSHVYLTETRPEALGPAKIISES